jgi:hypothetical protein
LLNRIAPIFTGAWTVSDEPGYVLHVGDRTVAAMQLAAHFTAEAMTGSPVVGDPRARLAEQLSYFDLAFRSIMGSTARALIKNGAPVEADPDRLRLSVS